MKYVLIIDQIRTGGAERILLDYYHYLKEKGHDVIIFALCGMNGQSTWTEGVNVIYGQVKNKNIIISKIYQQIGIFLKLNRLVRKEQPEVIFSFLEKSNVLNIVLPTKAKKIISVHNLLSIQYTKIKSKIVLKILYLIINAAYNKCKNIVAVSQQVKTDLITSFGVNKDNITIINNRADEYDIQEKSKEEINNFVFDKGVKYVLNVGRFSDQKAHWKLLKAFSIFKQKNGEEKVHLLIIGEGENRIKLVELSEKLNLTSSITFLPFNSNPYKYMAKADLFVLSSIYEGFPIVIAEVSSLGIPFVGTSTAIPREMFEDKDVWESSTFKSSTKVECSQVQTDEKKLAVLIEKGLFDQNFRANNLAAIAQWELVNDKEDQFNDYTTLIQNCI